MFWVEDPTVLTYFRKSNISCFGWTWRTCGNGTEMQNATVATNPTAADWPRMLLRPWFYLHEMSIWKIHGLSQLSHCQNKWLSHSFMVPVANIGRKWLRSKSIRNGSCKACKWTNIWNHQQNMSKMPHVWVWCFFFSFSINLMTFGQQKSHQKSTDCNPLGRPARSWWLASCQWEDGQDSKKLN